MAFSASVAGVEAALLRAGVPAEARVTVAFPFDAEAVFGAIIRARRFFAGDSEPVLVAVAVVIVAVPVS